MNKKVPYIIAGATSLIALISISSAMSISSKNKAAKAEINSLLDQIVRMEAHVPDADKEPEIIYLTDSGDTNQITVLMSQIEELQAATNRPPRQRGGDRGNGEERESFDDRMTRMKEEEPEAYAEMIQKREERSSKMRYALAERTATFMDLDTTNMTEEERANHELLVAKMARVWELTEQFQDPEAAPNREAIREMMEASREVRPLMDMERTVMFKQLGTDLGYEGEDAEAFASHVDEIIESTSSRLPGVGGRGGGGGGRGGGGGGR